MTEAITLTRYISLIQGQQILVFSSFTPTADFGLLAALTILIALVCDLTFLPALLGLVKPKINNSYYYMI